MKHSQLLIILGLLILFAGVALTFIFLFSDLERRDSFSEEAREANVQALLLRNSHEAIALSVDGQNVYERDHFIDQDGNRATILRIDRQTDGSLRITYTAGGEVVTVSESSFIATEVISAKRLFLAGVQFNNVTLFAGKEITGLDGSTYTISGIFSVGGGDIEITFIGSDGTAYIVPLTSGTSSLSYTTESGDTVSVGLTQTQAAETISSEISIKKAIIAELEAEAQAATEAGDLEKAQAALDKIAELEEEIATIEETVNQLTIPTTEETNSTPTATETTEAEPSSTTTTTTTTTTAEPTPTTATPTVIEGGSVETTSAPTYTPPPLVTGSQLPVNQTSAVDSYEYELYYDEVTKQWDINWGSAAIILIP